MRFGLLATGYLYPKKTWPVSDLLRKRAQLFRQRTANILSHENRYTRNRGAGLRCNAIKCLGPGQINEQFADANGALAIESNRKMMQALDKAIAVLKRAVLQPAKQDSGYR